MYFQIFGGIIFYAIFLQFSNQQGYFPLGDKFVSMFLQRQYIRNNNNNNKSSIHKSLQIAIYVMTSCPFFNSRSEVSFAFQSDKH